MKLALRKLFLPLAVSLASSGALADRDPPSFSTLARTPMVIEGLTTDNQGYLYAPGRGEASGNCPIYRIGIDSGVVTIVGILQATGCAPSGLAFDAQGRLHVSQGDSIYRLTPSASPPTPVATVFATGVPGTNGLAFDRRGNLWTGDGTTGQGRVWKIGTDGVAVEQFRVQPMANSLGVGRSALTLPPGTAQPLVANGLAFDARGDLLIADTARGAIWKVDVDRDGSIGAPMGCDTTFTANTLCLENVLVAHPALEGADGIALDVAGNIWVSVNERNAMVAVTPWGKVVEVFRNPPDSVTELRNTGPLEFPASPVLAGRKLCTSNSDNNRRDNSPPAAGELSAAGPDRGKVSCMDQRVPVRGVRLPVD